MDGIDLTQTHLEQVKSFKYLRSIVNGNNSTEEEIKGRISLGNKAFYANQELFKSKQLTKSVDKKNQLDVTFCIFYFSSNSCSTCFGQPCAHFQELTTA